MSSAELTIDRITVALHGVSADIVAAAAEGLAAELRRQLAGSQRPRRLMPAPEFIDLTPLTVAADIDAAALRGLLAQRLGAAIREAFGPLEAAS